MTFEPDDDAIEPEVIPPQESRPNQLQVIVAGSGLEQTKAQIILDKFSNYFQIAAEWEHKAKSIVVTDASQTAEMKMAREGRLFLKEKRVAIEKERTRLKEQSLREGKAIDAIANTLKAVIQPTETYLEQQEKFVEIKAAEEAEKLRKEVEARILKEQEDARIAKEKADVEERERIRIENERLKQEAETREKELAAERAKLAAERKKAEEAQKAAEAEQRRIREEAEKKEREAKAAAEAEKRAFEEAARKEREKREAEFRAEAERVQKKIREEQEKARQEEAEREKERKRVADEAAAKFAAERKAREDAERRLAAMVQCPRCKHKFVPGEEEPEQTSLF